MQGVRGSSPRSSTNRDETADPSPLAGAAGGEPSPRTTVTETPARTHRRRSHPDRALRPDDDRAALAGALGRARAVSDGPLRHRAAQVLPADDVPVSLGRHPHRPLVHHHADRRDRPLPSDARRERVPADRLRCVRTPGRERRDQEQHQPARLDDVEHRQHAAPAADDGRDVRLGGGGRHRRSRLLPLEPVVLPPVPEGRPRLPPDLAGRLVPQRRDPRPGAGRGRRPPLLALRREGREARPGPVVPQGHQVRRRASRLQRPAVAGTDQDPADELDRAERGRRDRLRHRPVRAPRGRRRAARLHDPPGHPVRGDVHGPRPRAPARGGADGARSKGGGRGVRRPGGDPDRDRSPVDRSREDRRRARGRRDQPDQRRTDPDLRRRLRPRRLRDRRDHGRPGPRRARLRVRGQVRPADPACRRAARGGRRRTDGRGVHPAYRRRGPRQQRTVHRAARRRGRQGDPRRAGSPRQGHGRGHLPPARLADQPPALLGHADPGHLLRAGRDRARARGGPARPTAGHRRLPRQRREPAQPRRGVPQRDVPGLRRPREARDRHDGHVRRLVLVLVSLPVTGEERRADRSRPRRRVDPGRPVHGRRRARGHAPAVRPRVDEDDARHRR